jgi:hypothetical protein
MLPSLLLVLLSNPLVLSTATATTTALALALAVVAVVEDTVTVADDEAISVLSALDGTDSVTKLFSDITLTPNPLLFTCTEAGPSSSEGTD